MIYLDLIGLVLFNVFDVVLLLVLGFCYFLCEYDLCLVLESLNWI